MNPVVKITLQHSSGACTPYRPADPVTHGIQEALVTCFARVPGDDFKRIDFLRCDMPGADWSSLATTQGGVEELQRVLLAAAHDLAAGHDPHIVVTLSEKRAPTNARLVTNQARLQAELADPNNRSMIVPRILPYQLGGTKDGAVAVVFAPNSGGGIRVHSMHGTEGEARVAEAELRRSGETTTDTLKVTTAATALFAQIARGEFSPSIFEENKAQLADSSAAVVATMAGTLGQTPLQPAGSVLRPPRTMSPFADRG
jgi:hypothetical protein